MTSHRVLGMPRSRASQAVDHLVEHEGQRRAPAHREAFLIGGAGLLDVDVEIAHRVHHARRLVHGPAGVGVGDQHVGRLEDGRGTRGCGLMSRSASPPTLSWNLA